MTSTNTCDNRPRWLWRLVRAFRRIATNRVDEDFSDLEKMSVSELVSEWGRLIDEAPTSDRCRRAAHWCALRLFEMHERGMTFEEWKANEFSKPLP